MTWRSTTTRFAALVFLLQLAAAGALLACVHVIVRGEVYADATAAGEVMRADLLDIYAAGGAPALTRAVAARARDGLEPGAVVLLTSASGRAVAGNLATAPGDLARRPGAFRVALTRTGRSAPEEMLLHATTLPDGAVLTTGSVIDSEARTVRLLELATPVALALALAFAALAAWLAARMIVVRIDRTVTTLGAVRGGELSCRVPAEAGDDAFALLADATNATLERIQRLVEELTLATDMLAHDLKSPLTRMRSALERAAAAADTLPAREAMERAQGESDRLLATVETALKITRAEAGIGRDAFVPVDVAAALADVAELYEPVAEDAGRAIAVDAPAPLLLPMHRELLAQALINLVDNALKYGAGTITLALAVADGRARIAVADEGAGIPPEHRATALRRFGRVDEARSTPGAGLGLSLVVAVARLHGGVVDFGHDGGFAVTMDVPLTE